MWSDTHEARHRVRPPYFQDPTERVQDAANSKLTLHTPLGTPTWKPVPHAEPVSELVLVRGLNGQGIEVVRDEYATMGREDARLFGVVDLRIPEPDAPDFGKDLSLRGTEDRSTAIQVSRFYIN